LSTEVIVIVMLGGQGTVIGVALGAYLYAELRSYLLTAAAFSNFQLVISGALLLLIVLFFPSGLMGWIYSRFPRTQKMLE
jgi:branched-chain amino acid transport system permease protein